MTDQNSACTECGMTCKPMEYHPFAACLMFKACQSRDTVWNNMNALLDRGREIERNIPRGNEGGVCAAAISPRPETVARQDLPAVNPPHTGAPDSRVDSSPAVAAALLPDNRHERRFPRVAELSKSDDPYIHEDQLPQDITDAEYDAWYAKSLILGGNIGVRVGPVFKRSAEPAGAAETPSDSSDFFDMDMNIANQVRDIFIRLNGERMNLQEHLSAALRENDTLRQWNAIQAASIRANAESAESAERELAALKAAMEAAGSELPEYPDTLDRCWRPDGYEWVRRSAYNHLDKSATHIIAKLKAENADLQAQNINQGEEITSLEDAARAANAKGEKR